MPSWKTIAREPLVHFLAIGALLFAVDAWRSPADSADDTPPPAVPAPPQPPAPAPEVPGARTGAVDVAARTIVVDADARAQIAANAERRLGRAPSAAELAAETERWIDEEVLYREAIARGLHRDDPMIHERIASRMSYVLEQSVVIPEPTEAELRAWFEQHRERWAVPQHVDFTHVFVAGHDAAAEQRATDIEAALAAGATPERLGDRFSGGRRYRGRKLSDLAAAFGDEFVDGLAAQPVGSWMRRRSRHGLHVVRVDRVDAGRDADFAQARLDVHKELVETRRAAELAAAVRRLRAGWAIEER